MPRPSQVISPGPASGNRSLARWVSRLTPEARLASCAWSTIIRTRSSKGMPMQVRSASCRSRASTISPMFTSGPALPLGHAQPRNELGRLPELHVALDRRAADAVALLVAQSHVDSHPVCCCLRQLLQSSSNQGPAVPLYGSSASLAGCFTPGGSGERSTILVYLPVVESEAPTYHAIDATVSLALAPPEYVPCLVHTDRSALASFSQDPGTRKRRGRRRSA